MKIDYKQNSQGSYDVYVENGLIVYLRIELTKDQATYLVKKLRDLLERPAKNLAYGNL